MQPTRRSLFLGGAALALTATSAFGHQLKDGWQIVGGNKFAHSLPEAMALLPIALRQMKFPVGLDKVREVIAANPAGRHGTITNGHDNLLAMVSGGGDVDFNVRINFRPTEDGLQVPVVNTMEWDIEGYTLCLPIDCYNWCYWATPTEVSGVAITACGCCVEVHYTLPAHATNLIYELSGPYSLDDKLETCGHHGQWEHGCVAYSCFRHPENFLKNRDGLVANWRKNGGHAVQDSNVETKGVLYLPHDVVNGFGLNMCVDMPAGERMRFSYGFWKDPFTKVKVFQMAEFQPL